MYPSNLDSDECSEVVPTPGMRMSYHQCSKKVLVEVEGKKYCRVHSPEEREKRRAKGDAKFHAEVAKRVHTTECERAVYHFAGRNPYLVKFLHDYVFKQAILGDKGARILMTLLEKSKRQYAIANRVRV